MPEASLLHRILAPGELSAVFQPVIDVSDSEPVVHYFEGLIRGPRGTSVEMPEILFEYARRKRCLAVVDRACVGAILEGARDLRGAPRLGINVHAPTLALDADFVGFLHEALIEHEMDPSRLVLEIVEHAPPWDVVGFRQALVSLREMGAEVALDDIGLGHSNYMMMLECRPDYLKVDRYFVTGSRRDDQRRAVLRSVAELAPYFGSRVVAEGVESREDLEAAVGVGIQLVQGWLFGEAQPAPCAVPTGESPPPPGPGGRATREEGPQA